MNKAKLLELLSGAMKGAPSKSGERLGLSDIQALYTDLYDNIESNKVNQWIALNKDKLAMIPELASQTSIIDISENPKVVQKDFGFTESDDFYKMEGPKSWMNKSTTYLRKNAEKYGMSLNEYLKAVQSLAQQKEQERQWNENAKVAEFKDVPMVGDVTIPGYTRIMLPTSFNKAALGKEVTSRDTDWDMRANLIEAGLATAPYGGPIWAALAGNALRQGKGIYDETQDTFHPGEFAGSGAIGAFGVPVVFKTASDIMKRVPGTQGIKQWRRATKAVEDIGEVDPQKVLNDKVKELTSSTAKYRDVNTAKANAHKEALRELAEAVDPNIETGFAPYNPTPLETRLYGKGSKLWRNIKSGEIITQKEYDDAMRLLQEYGRGPEWIPGRQKQSNLYARGLKIKDMPQGDVLINAWAEPNISKVMRHGANAGAGLVGGRIGTELSTNDKKAIANKIINSTDWGRYITGLPNNLTEEEIYLATVYGDSK